MLDQGSLLLGIMASRSCTLLLPWLLTICLYCQLQSTTALHKPLLQILREMETQDQNFTAQWYTQTLDHFNNLNNQTFQQRYFVNDLYWNKGIGPIFMYINGEGPVTGPPYRDDDEVVQLAKMFHGLVVTLEHRYYGLSVPFAELTTANLTYLSSRQALNDLAQFMEDFRHNVSNTSGAAQKLKYVTIGGSYSGALSAWFRLKYPHISVGSVASSGVVNAILDFTAFDEQVAESAGTDCAAAMRATTAAIEKLYFANDTAKKLVKDMFNASMIEEDGDFFYLMADAMAESIQYGFHANICVPLVDSYKSNNDSLVQVFAHYVNTVFYNYLGLAEWYATSYQQNVSVAEEKNARQWWFQKCSEVAYFQNAPPSNSVRSKLVNMTYHRNHCREVFGMDLFPDTDATNHYYGGNQTAATNVYFANGSQDPWRRASVMYSLSVSEPELTITCNNCGHCVDLGGCPNGCDDANVVPQARASISEAVAVWLKQSL